jgi:glycosyltransferase involved in cell wall biosynthesis
MLFKQWGPWQQELAASGVTCYLNELIVPDKHAPIGSLWHTLRLVRVIRRHRIGLIHCNEHELYPALRVAARWTHTPILTTLHWNLEPGYGQWAFRVPYQPVALQFLSRAQLQASRAAIPADLPCHRIKLLMSGLDLDEFLGKGGDGAALRHQWGVDRDTVVFGTASAIKPRKRLEDFIMLIARLRASGRKVLGVIAGGGPFTDLAYRASLEKLIERERLGHACVMIGNLDPITPFFKAIDVAVNTAEMEILSMSLCEGMACRLPTIAYAVGGNPETVHDPWCVVPLGDLDCLIDRAIRLADDKSFRQSLGELAERHVRRHFDAPVLAARQASIYEDILGTHAAEMRTPATRSRLEVGH